MKFNKNWVNIFHDHSLANLFVFSFYIFLSFFFKNHYKINFIIGFKIMKNPTKRCFCVAHPFTVFACYFILIFCEFNKFCMAQSFYCGPKLIINNYYYVFCKNNFRYENHILFFIIFWFSACNTRKPFVAIAKNWVFVSFECIDFIANVFEFTAFLKCVSYENLIRYNHVNIFINRGKNTIWSIIKWGLCLINISIYDWVYWSVAENCLIGTVPVGRPLRRRYGYFINFWIVFFWKIKNLKLLNRI